MNILITWGAGFIGSHIVDAWMHRGDHVYVIDNFSTGLLQNLSQHEGNPRFSCIQADIREKETMENILSDIRPDVVFHLAAQINVRESIKNPEYDTEVNVIGTIHLLDAMKKAGCKRMIFSSTGGAMFGGDCPPYDESMEACPETPYGISKRAIELLLSFYEKQYGITSTVLRYANVYGPRQNAQGEAGVVSIFLDKIHRNEAPTIYGDGSQTRDFIHVSDVVSANMHALDNQLTGIYHVGTGIETSVNQLWNTLAQLTGTSLVPQYLSALGEIQRTALNPAKLQKTGWKIERKIAELEIF